MDREEIQRILGRLKFGDEEQIRLKRLLAEEGVRSTGERIDEWLRDALLRMGGCPPEALGRWARGLDGPHRVESRRMVAAVRSIVLAMDLFLEEAGLQADGEAADVDKGGDANL